MTTSSIETTALVVAAARAVETSRPDRLFDDPFAARFIKAGGYGESPWADTKNQAWWDAMGDFLAVRTRYFDDFTMQSGDVRQFVFLAAGLDARAYRMQWPANTRLFEVDRPSVLTFKDEVLESVEPACERHTINADLQGDWADALIGAGFRPDEPTAWVAEGILVYFTAEEGDRMLAQLSRLSAPGSRLALEYANRAEFVTRLAGEDVHGATAAAPADLARMWRNDRTVDPVTWLAGYGWDATRRGVAELALEYGRPVPPALDPARTRAPRIDLIRASLSIAGQ